MMPRFWTDAVIDDVLSRIRAGERTADIAEEYCTTGAALGPRFIITEAEL